MADTSQNSVGNMEEPPYKKNLERLAALQDRLSKVQKTAESLLATVSGSGGDYTDKLVYTDVTRVSKYLETNKVLLARTTTCWPARLRACEACYVPATPVALARPVPTAASAGQHSCMLAKTQLCVRAAVCANSVQNFLVSDDLPV